MSGMYQGIKRPKAVCSGANLHGFLQPRRRQTFCANLRLHIEYLRQLSVGALTAHLGLSMPGRYGESLVLRGLHRTHFSF